MHGRRRERLELVVVAAARLLFLLSVCERKKHAQIAVEQLPNTRVQALCSSTIVAVDLDRDLDNTFASHDRFRCMHSYGLVVANHSMQTAARLHANDGGGCSPDENVSAWPDDQVVGLGSS